MRIKEKDPFNPRKQSLFEPSLIRPAIAPKPPLDHRRLAGGLYYFPDMLKGATAKVYSTGITSDWTNTDSTSWVLISGLWLKQTFETVDVMAIVTGNILLNSSLQIRLKFQKTGESASYPDEAFARWGQLASGIQSYHSIAMTYAKLLTFGEWTITTEWKSTLGSVEHMKSRELILIEFVR